MALLQGSRCSRLTGILALALLLVGGSETRVAAEARSLFVDGGSGNDASDGSRARPLQSIGAAIARLPDPLTESVEIRVAPGSYPTTGGPGAPAGSLGLMCRMKPGMHVSLVGARDKDGRSPVLAWEGDGAMVDIREGEWWIEKVQVGSGSLKQRRGVMVTGPAQVTLKDVVFRTRSHSDAGIVARRGGMVRLRGSIHLNENVREAGGTETFCGIIAEDHGIVEFAEREGALLEMGNGSLSVSGYGIIRLGCEKASITSWGEQSNTLAINNGGRIDVRNTTTTLRAVNRRNTPIGLEHDGHLLAEDAHLIIVGENETAIALQKASTLTCNDVELKGRFGTALSATSGSMFVGRFLGDVPPLAANTGASIHVEEFKSGGKLVGDATARHGAVITLPDRTIRGE